MEVVKENNFIHKLRKFRSVTYQDYQTKKKPLMS